MDSRKLGRIARCLLGYLVALLLAYLAVQVRYIGVDPGEIDASPGMYAFGDLILFVLVAAVAAIPSTVGLVAVLEPPPWLWWAYLVASLGLALTGLLAGILCLAPCTTPDSFLGLLQTCSILRILGAPPCFLLYLPGVILGAGGTRKGFVAACLFELAGIAGFALHIALSR